MTDAAADPDDQPDPDTPPPAASGPLRLVTRTAWVWAGAAALVMAAGLWAAATLEARDHGILDGGGVAARTSALMGLAGLLVPGLIAFVAPLAIAGQLGTAIAAARPGQPFGLRFAAGLWRVAAIVAGIAASAVALAAVAVAITALAAPGLAFDPGIAGLPQSVPAALAWAGLIAGVGTASGITGLAISSIVSGMMVRPDAPAGPQRAER